MRFYLHAVVILFLLYTFIPKSFAKDYNQPNTIPANDPSTFDIWSIISIQDVQQTVTPAARPPSVLLNVPLISQMPELPRGCEVTSLAMLLQYKGIAVNKLTLAKQVKKDSTPYRKINGKVYFGNPHYGFVGSMTSFRQPGFGVFHKPVCELANLYLKGHALNITGCTFDTVLEHLGQQKPVWVISTSTFDSVPSRYWQTWQTPHGPISITYKEHSVLLTGYDNQYVYFNDPLANIKNRKVPITSFIRGWEQYGRQAITYK